MKVSADLPMEPELKFHQDLDGDLAVLAAAPEVPLEVPLGDAAPGAPRG